MLQIESTQASAASGVLELSSISPAPTRPPQTWPLKRQHRKGGAGEQGAEEGPSVWLEDLGAETGPL